MDELIFLDVWTITLKNGVQISVHAQSFDFQVDGAGNVSGITAVPYDGIATSLVAVVPSEVACIVKRRDQGTLKSEYRLLGKIEYIDAADTKTQAVK